MTELRTAIAIINFFVTEQKKGWYDFPESSLNTLQEHVKLIQSMIDNGFSQSDKILYKMSVRTDTFGEKMTFPTDTLRVF